VSDETPAPLPKEAIVRSLLLDARAGEPPLVTSPDEITTIDVEDPWIVVNLALDAPPRALLARVHARLVAAWPHAEIEVRAGGRVFRGGDGFGADKHVLAVLGGKGGVGKSTVAVSLALTLAAMGRRVGLIDGDVNAPDIPHMLGVHPAEAPRGRGWQLGAARPQLPSKRPPPSERYGIELMSVGFVVPERFAPRITSRALTSSLFRYLVFGVRWSADVLIVDTPPGTGEELQVIAGELPLSGAVFVTTPQDLAQMDAERTLSLLEERGVPVIGVVKNMAAMTCPHCDREIDMYSSSSRLADAGVAVLGAIPFDVRLSVDADRGVPLVLADPRGPIAYEFARIGRGVARWLADRAATPPG
jgi:ATP-binding protein involved in chromosome partitioning